MLGDIAPLQTDYKGVHFKSRMEARWAVFFDECGADWEYEPHIVQVEENLWYLPDFLIKNVPGRVNGNLYVEVKGCMGPLDVRKIEGLSKKFPVLVLHDIFWGDTIREIEDIESYRGYNRRWEGPYEFNFETIDGDYFACHLGINHFGQFELFGDDSSYTCARDDAKTLTAYQIAYNSWR